MSGVPGVDRPWSSEEYLELSRVLSVRRAEYVSFVDEMRATFDEFIRDPASVDVVISLVKRIGMYREVLVALRKAEAALQQATRWVEGRVRQS